MSRKRCHCRLLTNVEKSQTDGCLASARLGEGTLEGRMFQFMLVDEVCTHTSRVPRYRCTDRLAHMAMAMAITGLNLVIGLTKELDDNGLLG
ncbi:unnamed protein product [Prunus armeniaca]|uniref:Uncharacterized protein n=1 Tax=Prunus armeniaca TaxID=36596 RepID=A0A6J5X658_PRUAR|nr:unnamed protein product [Prunus armeniaca]